MTMMETMTDVQERVSRGVAFLDENVPGWESKIILDEFDIASGCKCVCGFVFSLDANPGDDGFDYAVDTFDPDVSAGNLWHRSFWAEQNGFDFELGVNDYEDLQTEWVNVLTDRQNVS